MQHATRQKTKAALIRAAERLFAERGLGSVSVRDVTRAAGARNESAVHYHFGGMEALIREVFADRYREIERTRLARIADMDAAAQDRDIELLMEAAVGPLFEACLEGDGRLYARFCVQICTDPRFDVAELVRDTGMESATLIRDRVSASLEDVPPDMLIARLRQLFTISIVLVADYARLVEAGTAPPAGEAAREAAVSLAGFLRAKPAAPDAVARPVS
ncbi:MAG: TetR/AcrR family transcriptional regulator [Alphaproteobacteria bacterium]|nr:TetR/AcrR family transcriptional regulator [Alphaproteobacteria bacterium]